MKILVVGDQHFRHELPYASAFKDGRRGEWEDVKKEIHTLSEQCDAVVLIGDNLNSKNNASIVLREFVEFLNGFGDKEIHILVGNHERSGTVTALDFLKKVNKNKWHVYDQPTAIKLEANQYMMMIPYMTPALLGVDTKEAGVEYIKNFYKELDDFNGEVAVTFAHHAVDGSKIRGIPIALANEIVIPSDISAKKIFAGHIHEKQLLGDHVIMTGSIFTNEVGEHTKSVWIYDDVEDMVEEKPLPVRGIYKIDGVAEGALYAEIPDHSIVKAIVKDSFWNNEENMAHLKNVILDRFDASIIVEQYPDERTKVHFEDGVLDLSVENMLQKYAEAKDISYSELLEGFALINS